MRRATPRFAPCLLALLALPLLPAPPVLGQDLAPPASIAVTKVETVETPEKPEAPQVLAPELDALLDRIEAKAKTIRTLSSRVRLTQQQDADLLADTQVRYGLFRYAGPQNPEEVDSVMPRPARTRIDFDGVEIDGKLDTVDIRYIFDGYWMLETNLKDHSATRRQLRAKDDPRDLLAIGSGPWPIPLSFEKAAVMARFHVALGKEAPAEDKRETVRLILTPKKGVKMEVDRMELVFDKKTLEPIGATSTHGKDSTEILLSKPAFNPELPDKTFDTALPQGKEWQRQEVPIK